MIIVWDQMIMCAPLYVSPARYVHDDLVMILWFSALPVFATIAAHAPRHMRLCGAFWFFQCYFAFCLLDIFHGREMLPIHNCQKLVKEKLHYETTSVLLCTLQCSVHDNAEQKADKVAIRTPPMQPRRTSCAFVLQSPLQDRHHGCLACGEYCTKIKNVHTIQ